MLFRKKIQKDCAYCTFATQVEEGQYLCVRKGPRGEDQPCRKFKYDPCKRNPSRPKALDFRKYDDQDFSL